MTAFWIVAVGLAASAGAVLALPLWRRRSIPSASPSEANLAVYRDQFKELDSDVAAGAMTQAQYVQAREELERRVLAEASDQRAAGSAATSSRGLAAVVFVALPIVAIALYVWLGNPRAIGTPKHAATDVSSMTTGQFAAMTEKLAVKLARNPDDPQGWMMLGKAYKVLDRPKDAVAALERGIQITPADPEMLTEYAEALAMEQGGSFSGKPEEAIRQALKASPNHRKALTMAGAVAFEKKNYSLAIAHWERLFKQVKDDAELQKALLTGIAEASRLRTIASGTTQAITGRVQLDASLADKVDPADTVFVFARGNGGPGMPVAALRKEARDLPTNFRLDDTYAVNPSVRLASLPSIVIGARISKSGDAMPQSGDLQGYSAPTKLGASGVVITIKEIVP